MRTQQPSPHGGRHPPTVDIALQDCIGVVRLDHDVIQVRQPVFQHHRIGDEKQASHLLMLDDEPDARHIVDDRQYEDLEASHFVAVHRFDYLAEYAISRIGGVEYIGESQYADAAGEKVVQRPCMIFVSVRYEASYHLAELPAETLFDVAHRYSRLDDQSFIGCFEDVAVAP